MTERTYNKRIVVRINQKGEDSQVDGSVKKEKYYPVYINNQRAGRFSSKEMERIWEDCLEGKFDIKSFEDTLKKKNFYKKLIKLMKEAKVDENNSFTVLSIQSAEPKVLGLPWEALLLDLKKCQGNIEIS